VSVLLCRLITVALLFWKGSADTGLDFAGRSGDSSVAVELSLPKLPKTPSVSAEGVLLFVLMPPWGLRPAAGIGFALELRALIYVLVTE